MEGDTGSDDVAALEPDSALAPMTKGGGSSRLTISAAAAAGGEGRLTGGALGAASTGMGTSCSVVGGAPALDRGGAWTQTSLSICGALSVSVWQTCEGRRDIVCGSPLAPRRGQGGTALVTDVVVVVVVAVMVSPAGSSCVGTVAGAPVVIAVARVAPSSEPC